MPTVSGAHIPPPPALHHSLSGQPLLSPPKSSGILFLAHYKVPAAATLPASAPASLRKVTFNDPDVTPELEAALTGSAGSRGETVFVSVFLGTLN